jgi:hypothetical protein
LISNCYQYTFIKFRDFLDQNIFCNKKSHITFLFTFLFHLYLCWPKPITFFCTFPVWKWSYCVPSIYHFEANLNFISSPPMFTQANDIFLYFTLYENDHIECLACIILKPIWILFHLCLCSPKSITFFSTFTVWKWSYCVPSMYHFEANLNFISSLPMFTQANNIFFYFSCMKMIILSA